MNKIKNFNIYITFYYLLDLNINITFIVLHYYLFTTILLLAYSIPISNFLIIFLEFLHLML